MISDGVIMIRFSAVPNTRPGGGFLPRISVNGREEGDTFAVSGHSEAEAMRMASAMAQEDAARYIGDWTITIAPLWRRKAV